MTTIDGIKWEIVRGIDERMVSDFFRSVFLSETELSLDGIIQRLLDGERDIDELSLQAFAEHNETLFRQYAEETTGSPTGISMYSKHVVMQFIAEMQLQESYDQFRAEHLDEWNDSYDKDAAREEIVSKTLSPLLENIQKNSMYIYRDSDHYGIHLTRLLLNQ